MKDFNSNAIKCAILTVNYARGDLLIGFQNHPVTSKRRTPLARALVCKVLVTFIYLGVAAVARVCVCVCAKKKVNKSLSCVWLTRSVHEK